MLAVLQGHCHTGCVNVQNGIIYHTFRALCEGNQIPCAMITVDGKEIRIVERKLTKE